jgi:hypothetical protein
MKYQHHILWSDLRDDDIDGSREIFYVLAEQGKDEWTFFERSSWELRWYPIAATESLVTRALIESGNPRRISNIELQMKQVA